MKSMATPGKAGVPLGIMKWLDPCQLKPDCTETERILTVLDETIAKLEITRLIPRVIHSLERFSRMLGPEITRSLVEHQKLSMEIQHLLTSPGDEESRKAVEQHLKCSMRNILRLILANPLLYHGLKYEVWVRQSAADVFIKAFMEFRDLTLERLLTSPDEEKQKVQFMKETILQLDKNMGTISALQAELTEAIQTRDEEVNKKDKIIENLKISMENLSKECEAEIQQIMKEGEKQRKLDEEASQIRCAKLEEDVLRLRAKLKAVVQPVTHPGSSSPVQPGLGHCQGSRGSHSCSGHPVPGPAHPPREQFLPNIPSIPALWHWEAIPVSCPPSFSPVPLQLPWSPFRPQKGL
uniref:Dynein regulatory complex protein 10 n=1 Tax=Malurus cyaneus samueli TaxID=2593467 RepID=A0A8C5X5Q4_9PASS